MRSQSGLGALALSVLYGACTCQLPTVRPCQVKTDCAPDEICLNSECTRPGGADGGKDGGTVVAGCDPNAPDNASRDTDCDGLTDYEEYNTTFAGGRKTDPCNADTDADGLRDGLELGRTTSVNVGCGFTGDQDPTSKTDPTNPDSDGDGLGDGTEDANGNGRVDPGESNPLKKDTDCDGVSDTDELSAARGCKTDPGKRDTDGDGIPDGVETGLAAGGGADPGCNYPPSTFDQDPGTKTDACNPDSDSDGIMDGAEDTNQNGKLDPGELNPQSATDGQGPAKNACSTANLRLISFHFAGVPDLQVALVPAFTEVNKLVDGNNVERGVIFYDKTNQVAGLVIARPPVGANASVEETDARIKLSGLGGVSGAITQTFTTWDGFTQSVRASYDNGGSADLKSRANDIARTFLGAVSQGALAGSAGVLGPFKLQAELVRRSNNRAVLLFALTPSNLFTGTQLFRVDDVAGGSALAQYGDYTGTQCEVFATAGNANVDFLWVVDDSCSMADYQTAIGNAANRMAAKLQNSSLNWQIGAVTTDYYNAGARAVSAVAYRPFTTTTAVMAAWFREGNNCSTCNSPCSANMSTFCSPPCPLCGAIVCGSGNCVLSGTPCNQGCWFGTGGAGSEQALLSAQRYIRNVLLPRGTGNRFRPGAEAHLILLGDADDQSSQTAATYISFFQDFDGNGSKATVHGIVCPQGQNCGESQANPRKNLAVVQGTGGVLGDINVAQSASPQLDATLEAILNAAIAGTGRQLLRPPISATIKVAIETGATVGGCNTVDVPRDRTHGFDFDSATRRVSFFGNCRPSGPGKQVAVSYKYWVDNSPDPDGDPCGNKCVPPRVCDPQTGQCVCPSNCGGCPAGMGCDLPSCTCQPPLG